MSKISNKRKLPLVCEKTRS